MGCGVELPPAGPAQPYPCYSAGGEAGGGGWWEVVDGEAPHPSPLPVLKTGGGGRLGRGCSSALTPALSLAGEGVRAGACPLSVSLEGERPEGGRVVTRPWEGEGLSGEDDLFELVDG